ncbi:MAG TPA: hypothetical protein VFL97_10380 [Nitrococcus sp.]|nr:hypothetical protein [Nitrococcus sp.]
MRCSPRYGVRVKDPHPAAADVMGMSAVDIAQAMLSQQGRSPLVKTKAAIIRAAMTTSDFPDLMENIASKAAMVGFQEQEVATHRVWTRESQFPDFKQARRVALSEAPGLAQVNEGGEYTYGSFDDAKEAFSKPLTARSSH